MDIDNLNSFVINRSMVHGTWCTKSLRASDVIGIYWPENWDALSPLELRVPSWSSFLPSFQPFPPRAYLLFHYYRNLQLYTTHFTMNCVPQRVGTYPSSLPVQLFCRCTCLLGLPLIFNHNGVGRCYCGVYLFMIELMAWLCHAILCLDALDIEALVISNAN